MKEIKRKSLELCYPYIIEFPNENEEENGKGREEKKIERDERKWKVDYDFRDKRSGKKFKFEAKWMSIEGCEEAIRERCETEVEGSKVFQLVQKLKKCKVLLKEWSKKIWLAIR